MATQRQTGSQMDSRVSAVDLTGLEYHFCHRDANGALILPLLGGNVAGVIQEGKSVGRHSSFATGGQLKILAGAAINEDDPIAANADGTAKVAVAGQQILGRAMTAAAIGEMCTFDFDREGPHA